MWCRLIYKFMKTHFCAVKKLTENLIKKPFSCHICHVRFVMERNVRRHISTVHEQKRLFQCAICHKDFTSKQVLQRHVFNIHRSGAEGQKIIKQLESSIPCSVCDEQFPNRRVLANHISFVHDGKKGSWCPICSAVFTADRNMKR